MLQELTEAMVEMKEQEALEIARRLIAGGEDPLKILKSCSEAMETVGKRFETGEYFLPQLILAGEMLKQISEMLKPQLKDKTVAVTSESLGKVLMGTVKGDIHDIGKNIVAILLKGAGYEVNDLGIDVPQEKIIGMVREEKPNYLGLSALLTTTMVEMGVVIKALEENSLRDRVRVLIGGAAVSDEYAKEIGADAFCADGFQAIKVLEEFEAARS